MTRLVALQSVRTIDAFGGHVIIFEPQSELSGEPLGSATHVRTVWQLSERAQNNG